LRVGVVSDIHGNAKALERAFALMGAVDEVFCLGDSINQFRFSNEVVALLRERGARTILGNHEELFLGAGGERARAHAWIDRDLLDWLAGQPQEQAIESCGKRLLLIHSTPWSPRGEYVTPHNPAFARFGETAADILFYGHTHHKVAQRVGGTLVVNPGSTGEARWGQNDFKHSCAVVDVASEEVRHIDFEP